MEVNMVRRSLIVVALVLALVSTLVFAPAKPAEAAGSLTTTITGTFTDALGGTGTFTGTATITRFVIQNGKLAAVVTIAGTLVDSLGNVLGTASQTITTAITASGSCQILHLSIGPISLSLLGLNVNLSQITLDISASGGLLGGLLCAVANLLNSGGLLTTIVNLLNQILGLL
jgi:hypothetical protein